MDSPATTTSYLANISSRLSEMREENRQAGAALPRSPASPSAGTTGEIECTLEWEGSDELELVGELQRGGGAGPLTSRSRQVGGRVPHARLVWEAAEPGDYLIWARPLAGRAAAAANFDATLVVSGEEPREFRGTVEAGGEDVLIFDFSVKHQHTPTSPGYASPTASSRAREESVRSLADDFEPEPRDARIISSRRIADEEPERVVSRRYEDDGYSYRPARPTYQVNPHCPAWPAA